MRIRLIILSVFFIPFFISAQAKFYKLTYEILNSSPKNAMQYTIKGVLKGNKMTAVFIKESKVLSKTDKKEFSRPETMMFKNFHKKNKVIQIPVYKNHFIGMQDKLVVFDWQLTNEKKKIGKWNCRQAVSFDEQNKKISCWFTDELNIKAAPSIYDGLPGTVIFLRDGLKQYTLKKVEYFKKLNLPKLKEDLEIVSKETLMKGYQKSILIEESKSNHH